MAHLVVGVIFIVEYLKDEDFKVLTSPPPLLKIKKIYISGGFFKGFYVESIDFDCFY